MQNDDRNGTDDILRILQRALAGDPRYKPAPDSYHDEDRALSVEIPEIRTAAELIADAGRLPPMLVEDLVPDRSLFLLTGKPKAGKSFLALDIADSVCRGTPVFGVLRVNRRGPVLYLALEDGHIELARRLQQRDFHPPEDHDLYFITDAFSLTEPRQLAVFTEQAKALQPSLIVIDTAAEALDVRDWINRSEILARIAPMRRLARDICTVLLVAHNRKAEGDMGDEIAGSNALAGAVDGWISAHKVQRRENGNRRLFLRIEGRGGVGHEMIVEMDHRTLRFSRILSDVVDADACSARENSYTIRRQERRAIALKTLQGLGERTTIPDLAAAMGIGYNAAWSLVRELSARGDIEESTDAVHVRGAGRRTPTYRLIPRENTALG